MNVTDFQEIWQIDAGGQIYEAGFEEMAQWIFEGSLLPQDMVRRGNLRWIEARKVPALLKIFNDRDQGLPPPVFASTTDGQASSENFQNQTPWQETAFPQQNQTFNELPPDEFNMMPTAGFCSMHPDAPAAFLCGTCGNGFCPACPKSYGGTVKICPFCGAMCKSVREVQQKTQAAFQYDSDISKGFGFEDFFNALAYPFKFKSSLFFGAIMFMFFTLGQGAGMLGNIFLAGAGLICWMLSNMLTFGVLANTVDNFAQGKVGGNFMPSFDDFSLWDDVVHPFFLSIGVYLVSFGLVIVIIIGTLIWGLNQISNNISQSYSPTDNAKFVTDKDSPFTNNPDFRKQNEMYGDGEMPDESGIVRSQTNPDDTEEDVRRANDLINQQRKKQLESGLGKPPETVRQEQQLLIESFLKRGLPILILIFIGFLWGIFYFPAACCVAGYTRSFVATLNPTVGLETIKLLGWDYVKLWFMGFIILIVSFIVGMILGVIFMAFDMPTVGNIPAKAVGAMFGFYFSVVFSVILGFALYKNADKLNLFKG